MRTSRLPDARRSGAHSPLRSAPSFMAYHQTQCPRQHFVVFQRISVLKSAIVGSGNGFHIPYLVLIMFILVSEAASAPVSLECVFEKHLQEAVSGSPFDEAVLRSFPGPLPPSRLCLRCRVSSAAFPTTSRRPGTASISAWRGSNFGHWGLLRPTSAIRAFRSLLPGLHGSDSTTVQYFRRQWVGKGQQGILGDHLLPPGLSKDAHMQQAFSVPSPFHRPDAIDPDLMFSCLALRVWGPLLPVWRQQVRRLLHRLVHAFHAVESFFVQQSCVQGLTSRSPLTLAVFTVLLDWPDVSQPLRYLTGFPAVGHIEHRHL